MHIEFWLAETRLLGDKRAELCILNEQMGLFRKLNKKDRALETADYAISFSAKIGQDVTLAGAFTFLNAATVYNAFGDSEYAIELFVKAEALFQDLTDEGDERRGGLYNNMALAYSDVCRYEEAENYFLMALKIMQNSAGAEGECAITYLNMADMYDKQLGSENAHIKTEQCLDEAEKLMNLPDVKKRSSSNHAYICEKCASVFGYYGRFIVENELKAQAVQINTGKKL